MKRRGFFKRFAITTSGIIVAPSLLLHEAEGLSCFGENVFVSKGPVQEMDYALEALRNMYNEQNLIRPSVPPLKLYVTQEMNDLLQEEGYYINDIVVVKGWDQY